LIRISTATKPGLPSRLCALGHLLPMMRPEMSGGPDRVTNSLPGWALPLVGACPLQFRRPCSHHVQRRRDDCRGHPPSLRGERRTVRRDRAAAALPGDHGQRECPALRAGDRGVEAAAAAVPKADPDMPHQIIGALMARASAARTSPRRTLIRGTCRKVRRQTATLGASHRREGRVSARSGYRRPRDRPLRQKAIAEL
jgi:hypothetical protein